MFFTPSTAVGLQIAWYTLGSIGVGFGFAVFWSMLSDTVEFGEWKTGIRAEGGTFSIASFVIKVASAVAGGLLALILARTGYVPQVEKVNRPSLGFWL
jgi:glucuronide carrier protein